MLKTIGHVEARGALSFPPAPSPPTLTHAFPLRTSSGPPSPLLGTSNPPDQPTLLKRRLLNPRSSGMTALESSTDWRDMVEHGFFSGCPLHAGHSARESVVNMWSLSSHAPACALCVASRPLETYIQVWEGTGAQMPQRRAAGPRSLRRSLQCYLGPPSPDPPPRARH